MPPERQKNYDTVNKLVKQHVPMIPVAHGGSGTAFKADVEGADSQPAGQRVTWLSPKPALALR